MSRAVQPRWVFAATMLLTLVNVVVLALGEHSRGRVTEQLRSQDAWMAYHLGFTTGTLWMTQHWTEDLGLDAAQAAADSAYKADVEAGLLP